MEKSGEQMSDSAVFCCRQMPPKSPIEFVETQWTNWSQSAFIPSNSDHAIEHLWDPSTAIDPI